MSRQRCLRAHGLSACRTCTSFSPSTTLSTQTNHWFHVGADDGTPSNYCVCLRHRATGSMYRGSSYSWVRISNIDMDFLKNSWSVALVKKHEAANDLKDMVDSIRDAEGQRVFPTLLNTLLDILRNTEPSFKRDTQDFQFRRVIMEIIHRIPLSEALRPIINTLTATLLHVIKTDTEENAVTCLKIIIDIVRTLKTFNEEHVKEFLAHVQDMLRSVERTAAEYFTESSPVLDANISLPSNRSFKVMSEVPVVVVLFSQMYRQVFQPFVPELLSLLINVRVQYFDVMYDG